MTLHFGTSDFPENVADIFSLPENKEDFYLYSEFIPWISESYIYPGLKYDASFHLHINKIDEGHTELIIKTIKPRVITGKEFWPSFPHFSRDYKYHDVELSTIEEYEILYKIGQSINEDMPQVQYPH